MFSRGDAQVYQVPGTRAAQTQLVNPSSVPPTSLSALPPFSGWGRVESGQAGASHLGRGSVSALASQTHWEVISATASKLP